jgi:hypothetical protein
MTTLLFPYVTHAGATPQTSGFDTGIVITNASAEPFGKPQAGKCDVHFFGQRAGGGLTPTTTSARVEPGAQHKLALSQAARVSLAISWSSALLMLYTALP